MDTGTSEEDQMKLYRFLEIAGEWDQLGDAVKAQLVDMAYNGEEPGEQNVDALKWIVSFLQRNRSDLDGADSQLEEIEAYLDG